MYPWPADRLQAETRKMGRADGLPKFNLLFYYLYAGPLSYLHFSIAVTRGREGRKTCVELLARQLAI